MNNLTVQKKLQKAIMSELKTRHIDEISINEISDIADVARSSFYRYYHTIEDAVMDYFKILFEEKVKIIPEMMNQSTLNNVKSLFNIVKEHQDEFGILVKDKMYDVLFITIKNFALHNATVLGIDDQYYIISAYSGAICSLIIEWFNEGLKKDVSELVKMFSFVIKIEEK